MAILVRFIPPTQLHTSSLFALVMYGLHIVEYAYETFASSR